LEKTQGFPALADGGKEFRRVDVALFQCGHGGLTSYFSRTYLIVLDGGCVVS
jgi:hypothetical protein